MYLEWKEEYNIAVKPFDSQHKKILDKINEMYDELNAGNKKEVQSKLIDELINIAEEHFSDEERELEAKNYPDYLDHLAEHKNLLGEINDLKDRYLADQTEIDLELIDFLGNWLIVHITDMDKGYAHLFS